MLHAYVLTTNYFCQNQTWLMKNEWMYEKMKKRFEVHNGNVKFKNYITLPKHTTILFINITPYHSHVLGKIVKPLYLKLFTNCSASSLTWEYSPSSYFAAIDCWHLEVSMRINLSIDENDLQFAFSKAYSCWYRNRKVDVWEVVKAQNLKCGILLEKTNDSYRKQSTKVNHWLVWTNLL